MSPRPQLHWILSVGFLAVLAASSILVFPLLEARAAAPSAEEILAASDAVRVPEKAFSLTVTLVEYRSGREKDRMTVIAYSKAERSGGQYRSLVRIAQPPRDENKLLLKVGNLLWFFDPASKATVRISPQQRLLGQASNGDVVTVNLHKDYTAVLEKEETILDAEKKRRDCYKLNLGALNDSVTYHRIEYWVDMENFQPVKGKYYSESERLLKIAYLRRYREELGRDRPTEVIIIDGVDSKLVTTMTYSDFHYRDIPEEWLQKDYLPRFRGN